jgi:hypothetical protein
MVVSLGVLTVKTIEEAKEVMNTDPPVRSRCLTNKIHPAVLKIDDCARTNDALEPEHRVGISRKGEDAIALATAVPRAGGKCCASRGCRGDPTASRLLAHR